jgi:hypothetical protein
MIIGDRGRQIPNGDTVGPFKEDDPFTVLCVATGGEIARPFQKKSSKMEVMDIVS